MSPQDPSPRLLERTLAYEGRVADVEINRYQRPSGAEVTRQVIAHPGAVAVLAYDEESVYLVRQPREAVGEGALIELVAGTLDLEGESPEQCARRELAEELGMEASEWRDLGCIYPSPGYTAEAIRLFAATGLSKLAEPPARDGDEEIEIVRWPLARLGELAGDLRDAKTLVAVQRLLLGG